MPKTRLEFDRLVERLTEEAARHPAKYKTKVALLALSGYAYIALVVLAVVAVFVVALWVLVKAPGSGVWLGKLVLPLLGFGFVIAKVVVSSLWVKFPEPEGIRLEREAAPRLFEVVEATRRAVRAPAIEAIVLSDDFNAAVSQVPRLGVFGWHRNFLICGLPLMEALSPEQFRAVLAHEMGHLSHAHGRFGAWVYSVRATWGTIMGLFEQQRHFGAFIFRWFFDRFAFYFNAYSLVLARRQEYEADRLAAECVGARAAADALVSSEVHGAMLAESFWPSLTRRVATDPQPPASLLGEMRLAFRSTLDTPQASRWVRRALRARTHSGDSHPSLPDRLAALGEEARVAPPEGESAAEALLGYAAAELAARLDRDWQARAQQQWRLMHEESGKMRERLTELERKAAEGTLEKDEAFERARAVEQLSGGEAAVPLYRKVLAGHPSSAQALFALGAILLERDDDEGMELLRRAAELDLEARLPALGLIYDHLLAQGREAEAAEVYETGARHADELDLAVAEREVVDSRCTYLPHGLDEEALAQVVASLAELRGLAERYYTPVSEFYLTRKQLEHLPERPLYVLGALTAPGKGREIEELSQANQQLAEKLADKVQLQGEVRVVVLADSGETRTLIKKWQKVPGSKLSV